MTVVGTKEHAMAQLWRLANQHAIGSSGRGSRSSISSSRDLVVVLATSGYSDMLDNFLDSLHRSGSSSNILIITPPTDAVVFTLGSHYGVGVFQLASSLSFSLPPSDTNPLPDIVLETNPGITNCFLVTSDTASSTTSSPIPSNSHDFGTLCYQKLILMRTTTVMYLLFLGFSPLIADIDVVWRANALAKMHELVTFTTDNIDSSLQRGSTQGHSSSSSSSSSSSKNSGSGDVYDVAVTMDNTEICGCFVYLVPSRAAIGFWAQLAHRHYAQVANATAVYSRTLHLKNTNTTASATANAISLVDFFDSEQKLLTEMILERECNNHTFHAFILPPELFPSGLQYFNEWTEESEADASGSSKRQRAIVVHNNFIVGDDIKKMRFKLNGLWTTLQDRVAVSWRRIFNGRLVFTPSIPTLVQYMPIHNSLFKIWDTSVLQGGLETFMVADRALSVSWSSDPPVTYGCFGPFFMYHMAIKQYGVASVHISACSRSDPPLDEEPPVAAMTPLIDRGVYADVATDINYFAVDRGNKFHSQADGNAHRYVQEQFQTTPFDPSSSSSNNFSVPPTPASDMGLSYTNKLLHDPVNSPATHSCNTNSSMKCVRVSIKVLAYNRPQSLSRLLASLGKYTFFSSLFMCYTILNTCT